MNLDVHSTLFSRARTVQAVHILTDAVPMPDEPFEKDLCGDCEERIRRIRSVPSPPTRLTRSKCFYGIYDTAGLLKSFGPPKLQARFDEYNTKPTKNAILPCMAFQRACPYGKEERGCSKLPFPRDAAPNWGMPRAPIIASLA